jgi:hypothetical protein
VLVPNQVHIFDHRRPDHRRPVTTFAHLLSDLAAGSDKRDLTHLEAIVALHDLERGKPAGSIEQFRERCLRNAELRCMHHHVFSLDLLEKALRHARFRPLYRTGSWENHLFIFACRD